MKKILFTSLLLLCLFNLYGWNVYQNVYLKKQTYSINYTDAVVADVAGPNGISNLDSVLNTIITGVSPSNFSANAPVFQLGTQSNSDNSYITMYYFTNNVAKGGEATSIIGNFNSGEIDRVIVTLNSNHGSLANGDLWNWTSGTDTKAAFRSLKFILEHELLHCAGVAHTEIDGRLMFDRPFVSNLTGITVSNDEKLALNAIYNPPKIFEQNWTAQSDSNYTFVKGEQLKFKVKPTLANNSSTDYKANVYIRTQNNPYFPAGQQLVNDGTEITLDTKNDTFIDDKNKVSIYLDGIEAGSFFDQILNAHKRGFTANIKPLILKHQREAITNPNRALSDTTQITIHMPKSPTDTYQPVRVIISDIQTGSIVYNETSDQSTDFVRTDSIYTLYWNIDNVASEKRYKIRAELKDTPTVFAHGIIRVFTPIFSFINLG